MYIKRHFSLTIMYFISWRILIWSFCTGAIAFTTYDLLNWKWVAIPWLPVSLIGTAVAFYVGFKNNQSYDRSWEARKIWGGIVNTSRSFCAASKAFITNDFATRPVSQAELKEELRVLIYRHIGWLYALKHAMWQRTNWEHQFKSSTRQRNYFSKRLALHGPDESLARYLSAEEMEWIKTKKNRASQLLDKQSQHLAGLRKRGLIDDFRHMELQRLISELYSEQGRSERIKNTPLPRQYATSSSIFILLFTFLLPFGMLTEFSKLGDGLMWLLVPFNLVVSWVFTLMEYIGDYSENPFEGLLNDVPIYSIVRNTEIDLKDMLDEEDLPERVEPVFDVLF
jgi:ion channel-forming bestrophin family protein